jgi:histone deacetylase 1/2
MRTRGKHGFRVPAIFQTAPLSPVPRTYRAALADSNWRAAMEAEYSALLANNTWDLVPRPPRANVVTGKWVFKHKFKADGSLERYKARWVLRGFTQRPGVDFTETFSPIVKPTTVRTVLSLALSRSWPIHQLDVNNAFLQGTLSETVFCAQPAGFEDSEHPDLVCRLNRSLYGLKQAPRAWYSRFASFLLKLGFAEAKTDLSLFIYHSGADTIYLLLYVDDIVLTASSSALLQRIISALQHEFSLKDLGQLHHFLGMHVQHTSSGLFLSQRQYM